MFGLFTCYQTAGGGVSTPPLDPRRGGGGCRKVLAGGASREEEEGGVKTSPLSGRTQSDLLLLPSCRQPISHVS